MNFFESVKQGVEEFNKLKDKPVRIIGHLDSDGLTSTSILIKTFKRAKIKFASSVVRQIDETLLKELAEETYEVVFFVDLGASSLSLVNKILKDKQVFILDHHKPDTETNFVHINPHLCNLEGEREISGAGVVYFFSKFFDEKNIDLAYLALIGAIGDIQERNGFIGLNRNILEDSINSGKIEVKRGLRMFGMQTKPLSRVLEYSTDPYIPGVTGDRAGSLNFLEELGISVTENGQEKKISQLTEEEVKKLVTGIILKRLGSEDKPDDVLGMIYLLTEEKEDNPMRDAREFSTLLNSCGRLNKPSVGIASCLGDEDMKEEALEILQLYKKEIISGLNWFYSNRNSDKVLESNKYVIINAADQVRETLIGTLASIISRSNFYPEGTIILSNAYTLDGNIKISLRLVGRVDKDLRDVAKKIVDAVGSGVAGGHKFAAGALIPQDKETIFLEAADRILGEVCIEEKI